MKNIVTITKKASDKLGDIARSEKTRNILFSVSGSGCNGMKYNLEPIGDDPDSISDTESVHHEEFSLRVCKRSLFHLLGTNIDWKKDIMGESFVFDNPMAASKCGCGTSFSSSYDPSKEITK